MADEAKKQGEAPRMPWEGDETSAAAVEGTLTDLLTDDPDFGVGDTLEGDESEEAADEAAESEDESEDVDDSEEESDDDEDEDAGEDAEDEDEDDAAGDDEDSEEEDPQETPEKQGLRLADYTRKTQELAERRKALEADQASVKQKLEEYGTRLERVKTALQEMGPKDLTAAEWDTLRQKDPAEFAARWAEAQQFKQNMAALEAEQERVQTEQANARAEELKALKAEETQKLVTAVPELKEKEKLAALKDYAVGLGFTEEQLATVYDHRLLVLLHKAQKLDALNTEAKPKLEGKRKAAKVLPAGGRAAKGKPSKSKKLRQHRQKLARTGSAEAAERVLMEMLDD